MKSLNMLALGLAALTAAPMAAYAQQEAPKSKLQAFVVINKKPNRIHVMNATGKGSFIFFQEDQQMQMNVKDCGMFMFITPADYAAVLNDYRAGDIASARKKAAAVKSKYAEYVGLPGNPATEAALIELDCALRMQDWAAVKTLAGGFAHPEYLADDDKRSLAVAKVLGNISDDAGSSAAQKEAVESLLKGEDSRKLSLVDYGRLCYALGRALEAQVPADQLNGTVKAEQAAGLIKAVDSYCQTAVSTHGADMQLPLDAMQRAMRLLWAQPGVKDYAAGCTGEMDKARWNNAPVNFKDAVVLAWLMQNVYTANAAAALPQKALIDELAKYYFNAEQGKAPEPAAEAPAEG